MSIGLQLWTLREECERDLPATLARVGEQGYAGVELFQLHGRDAHEVRRLLDEHGLAVAGRHAGLDVLEGDLQALADELRVLGTAHVALSWVDPEALERPEPLVERIAAVGREARSLGLRLGFHNHWTEPVRDAGGVSFLDRLRALPAEELWLELDLGWIWQAGVDPGAELAATRGRCPLVHLKDYARREDRDDVPVGDGVVGYAKLVPAALAAGAEWLVVEEDEAGADPFAAVERSLRNVERFLPA